MLHTGCLLIYISACHILGDGKKRRQHWWLKTMVNVMFPLLQLFCEASGRIQLGVPGKGFCGYESAGLQLGIPIEDVIMLIVNALRECSTLRRSKNLYNVVARVAHIRSLADLVRNSGREKCEEEGWYRAGADNVVLAYKYDWTAVLDGSAWYKGARGAPRYKEIALVLDLDRHRHKQKYFSLAHGDTRSPRPGPCSIGAANGRLSVLQWNRPLQRHYCGGSLLSCGVGMCVWCVQA